MRLLTHNMLQCNVSSRSCKGPKHPLEIDKSYPATEWRKIDAEFNGDFLARLLQKIDWPAFTRTVVSLGLWKPIEVPPSLMEREETDFEYVPFGAEEDGGSAEWWHALHSLLLENELVTGKLICPGCGHVFPVTDTIPNMLLKEEEV